MVSADKKKKKQLDFPTENMLDSRTENKMRLEPMLPTIINFDTLF